MTGFRDGFGKEPRLRTIVSVNVRIAFACTLLLGGWACWQWTSPQWWGLGIAAMLGFVGGAVGIIATVHEIVSIFARERKIEVFKEQGAAARADRMAKERDLRERGMIR